MLFSLQLLRIGPLIISTMKLKWLAMTPRERREAQNPGSLDFGVIAPSMDSCSACNSQLDGCSGSTHSCVLGSRPSCGPSGVCVRHSDPDHYSIFACLFRDQADHLPVG